jgi:alpha-beta hydrolase superfamily lysophospholipase
MTTRTEWELTGARGRVVVSTWPNDDARYVALLAHGYGEHVGRYDHVARALVEHGAVVYGPDHLGHGKSEGEPVLIEDVEDLVSDSKPWWSGRRRGTPVCPSC